MINKETIGKIALLSKINVKDSEMNYFSSQLSQIFEMINSINDIDLEDIEPLTSICYMNLRTRQDIVTDMANEDDLFANTNHGKEIHCFVVPKVIE